MPKVANFYSPILNQLSTVSSHATVAQGLANPLEIVSQSRVGRHKRARSAARVDDRRVVLPSKETSDFGGRFPAEFARQ